MLGYGTTSAATLRYIFQLLLLSNVQILHDTSALGDLTAKKSGTRMLRRGHLATVVISMPLAASEMGAIMR